MEKGCSQRPGQRFRLGSRKDYIGNAGRAGQMDPALPAFLLDIDMIQFSCNEAPWRRAHQSRRMDLPRRGRIRIQ